MDLNFVCLLGVLCGFLVFCSMQEHLLSSLLSLEFMVLLVFYLIVSLLGVGLFYSLIYLIMAACEGALGLSILVIMSRTNGGDYFKSFSLL